MTVKEICEKISMPPEVTQEILSYEPADRELLYPLTEPASARDAYQALQAECSPAQKGMDLLACLLSAAEITGEHYQEAGIDETIFIDTMQCFARFVMEYKASFGCYGFDRGWWTYRQLSMLLFRLGTLEYEYRDDRRAIHIHIPTGADLSLPACAASLEACKAFTARFFPERQRYRFRIGGSWLLSPVLKHLLPENCNIIRFQNCFTLTAWDQKDTDFLQWVYGRRDIPYQDLPEQTGLQRAMKRYLLQGGIVGSCEGSLRGFREDRRTQ